MAGAAEEFGRGARLDDASRLQDDRLVVDYNAFDDHTIVESDIPVPEGESVLTARFRRGEGLLCIGYNHVPIAFYATQKEYDAITTSPTDLLNRKEREV